MDLQNQIKKIMKEGNLKKRSRVLKSWRQRWFVLTEHYLLTFKERRVYKNPTQIILLKDIDSIKSAEQQAQKINSFRIDTKQATFFIGAETSVEKQQWIGAIGKAMVKSNSNILN